MLYFIDLKFLLVFIFNGLFRSLTPTFNLEFMTYFFSLHFFQFLLVFSSATFSAIFYQILSFNKLFRTRIRTRVLNRIHLGVSHLAKALYIPTHMDKSYIRMIIQNLDIYLACLLKIFEKSAN